MRTRPEAIIWYAAETIYLNFQEVNTVNDKDIGRSHL